MAGRWRRCRPNPGQPTTAKFLMLRDHPVEPPGSRPPCDPLPYRLLVSLGIIAFLGLPVIDVFGK